MKTHLRQNAISSLREGKIFNDSQIISEFFRYLDAYCAELKHTEWDVLLNDEHYDYVYNLFDNVILKNKPELIA